MYVNTPSILNLVNKLFVNTDTQCSVAIEQKLLVPNYLMVSVHACEMVAGSNPRWKFFFPPG